MEKQDIRSLSKLQLSLAIDGLGEKSFRSGQIYDWLHHKLVNSFEEMTNLPKDLREKLKEQFELKTLEMVKVQISELDGTRKYLFRLPDGNMVESVWMEYKHGNSVCISTQVGCRMGCRFCASAINGLERSLSSSEMLEQIYQIQKHTMKRVSHVVVMGIGEPMDNYDNLILFLKLCTDDNGLHISQRNITISTCGIVPAIYKFAGEQFAVTLAISLHAPNDEKRRQIMPIAYQYPLKELLKVCQYYFDQTGRRITFEYSLISGFNDMEEDAIQLIALIKKINCHINLIPVNPIKESDYVQSQKKVIDNFKNKLEKSGINVTIRREMGKDIDGACGQLRQSMSQ